MHKLCDYVLSLPHKLAHDRIPSFLGLMWDNYAYVTQWNDVNNAGIEMKWWAWCRHWGVDQATTYRHLIANMATKSLMSRYHIQCGYSGQRWYVFLGRQSKMIGDFNLTSKQNITENLVCLTFSCHCWDKGLKAKQQVRRKLYAK